MEPKKHQYIDSLRGVAILFVLLVHNLYLGSGASFFPPALISFFDDGQFGVQLFFMVSAYTLMSSFYSRQAEHHKTRNFFIRRFFRIAPLYYVAIVYFTFQNFLGFHYFSSGKVMEHISAGRLLSNIFFLNGFNPYWINNYVPGGWSIAVEMIFYLTLPFICKVVKDVRGAVILVVGSLVASAVLEHFLHGTFLRANEYLYYYFPNQLPIFSLGILAFFVVKEKTFGITAPALLLLAAAVFIFNFIPLSHHFSFSLVFFILLIVLTQKPYKLIVNGALSHVGKVSFSMYLVHFAIMYWMVHLKLNELIPAGNFGSALSNFACRFLLLFGISFLLSHVSYQLVEVPFQKLGKQFIQRAGRLVMPDELS